MDSESKVRVPVMVRLPARQHEALKRRAEAEARSLSAQAQILIEQGLLRGGEAA